MTDRRGFLGALLALPAAAKVIGKAEPIEDKLPTPKMQAAEPEERWHYIGSASTQAISCGSTYWIIKR